MFLYPFCWSDNLKLWKVLTGVLLYSAHPVAFAIPCVVVELHESATKMSH